ncbi:hypothetical protein NEMBOFW57_004472 [Staphylotrichum longicolle]|uniref:Uncharacterized protein n=1 Tax=Staphylotrichum longicolle TaxID=669026 RepID=A0AAD4F6W5_9PEZI|nr:hypothetical protein NEMBOFW57_004472 [Staphylotrichum longicolle]
MDIQDASMGGQRHEGSRLIDRYMLPQVRRYKHFHRKAKKSQPEPRPRTDRLGSTDSAATLVLGPHDSAHTSEETRGKGASKGTKVPSAPDFTTTEADAIVIFVSRATLVLWKATCLLTPYQMPILGFERHRHRKFLTQAFYEVDYAMQLARRAREDEDTDSTIWANPKLPGPQRRSAKIDAESSDDENLSTDQDQTRFDPLFWRTITHGREQVKTGREALLLNGYLDSEQVKPVHCRRTLDQFSYYMLNSTEARDKSQVAYRWAKNLNVRAIKPKDRPIVMVDQLWLWAFHDGTVLTSSPSTWDGHESFNLSNVIMYELRENKDRGIIRSIEDLLHLILKTSVDFFRRKGPANFRFQESFQSSINNVSEQQGHLFKNFRRTTKKLHIGTLDPAERKKEIEFLFSLDDETELLVEIMDIQDELTIVKTILSQQLDVLEKFLRLYPKKAEEDVDEETRTPVSTSLGKSELTVLQNLVQLLKDQVSPPIEERTPLLSKPGPRASASFRREVSPGNEYITPSDEQLQNAQFPKTPRPKGKEKETEPPKPTAPIKMNILQNRDLMYETIGIVENNLRIVADMLAYAEKVERSLENLLDLKQKHANGWEARFAREGSEESQRQGNIILVFTLVTVVFLPLSFITSFFALEIDIFPKNPETSETSWPIGQVASYLFGFSALIFIPLIVLALYVNKLITNIKEIYKQLLKALKEPEALLSTLEGERGADHDSDDEGTIHREAFEKAQLQAQSHHVNIMGANYHYGGAKADNHDGSSDDEGSKPGRYAPLFGRYRFHVAIPLVRYLWRYRQYLHRNARRKNNRWKDTYVTDYPLRHYQRKVNIWVLHVLVTVLAFLGSGKHRAAEKGAGGDEQQQ